MRHIVVVNDYTPGTGPSVMIHKQGCDCHSVESAKMHVPCGNMNSAYGIAMIVARWWGLDPIDYNVNDCALGYG